MNRALLLRRAFSSSEAATQKKLLLSFAAPHASLFYREAVESVTLPGASGEYGVTVGHSPVVEQLKPGVVTVVRAPGDSQKYFVSGGFAFTDPEQTDVSVAEAVELDDLDAEKLKAAFAAAKANLDADDEDTKTEASLQFDAAKAMASALGISL